MPKNKIINRVVLKNLSLPKLNIMIEKLKTPRRYGKIQIEKDIIKQCGVATELQKTMLALNELKSLYLNLQSKGTSDRYRGTNKISVSDGKKIRDAIYEFKKEIEHITHPKGHQALKKSTKINKIN